MKLRDKVRDVLSHKLPQPEIKIQVTNSISRELIEASLADSTTPDSEREYLNDLLRRKYS